MSWDGTDSMQARAVVGAPVALAIVMVALFGWQLAVVVAAVIPAAGLTLVLMHSRQRRLALSAQGLLGPLGDLHTQGPPRPVAPPRVEPVRVRTEADAADSTTETSYGPEINPMPADAAIQIRSIALGEARKHVIVHAAVFALYIPYALLAIAIVPTTSLRLFHGLIGLVLLFDVRETWQDWQRLRRATPEQAVFYQS